MHGCPSAFSQVCLPNSSSIPDAYCNLLMSIVPSLIDPVVSWPTVDFSQANSACWEYNFCVTELVKFLVLLALYRAFNYQDIMHILVAINVLDDIDTPIPDAAFNVS